MSEKTLTRNVNDVIHASESRQERAKIIVARGNIQNIDEFTYLLY